MVALETAANNNKSNQSKTIVVLVTPEENDEGLSGACCFCGLMYDNLNFGGLSENECLVKDFDNSKLLAIDKNLITELDLDKLVVLKPKLSESSYKCSYDFLKFGRTPASWDKKALKAANQGVVKPDNNELTSTQNSADNTTEVTDETIRLSQASKNNHMGKNQSVNDQDTSNYSNSDSRGNYSSSSSSSSSEDDMAEKKDLFMAQLYNYYDILDKPLVLDHKVDGKDLDYFALFNWIQFRGKRKVFKQNLWANICQDLGIGATESNINVLIRVFNDILEQFHNHIRSLGNESFTNASFKRNLQKIERKSNREARRPSRHNSQKLNGQTSKPAQPHDYTKTANKSSQTKTANMSSNGNANKRTVPPLQESNLNGSKSPKTSYGNNAMGHQNGNQTHKTNGSDLDASSPKDDSVETYFEKYKYLLDISDLTKDGGMSKKEAILKRMDECSEIYNQVKLEMQ